MSLPSRFVLFLILFCTSFLIKGQEKYKKVRVDLVGKEFKKLLALDLDIDHAKPIFGRYIDLEIPESDILKLNTAKWKYSILEDDLEKFYSNPHRVSEIDLDSRSAGCSEKKCDSYSSIISPSNFKLGSMGGFYTYQEMLNTLDEMKKKYPHLITERNTIGNYKTHNGNPLQWLRISNNPNQRQNKPQILYTALHHAREPMSLSQMIYFMWYLLENYDKNNVVSSILNNTELYFVPCLNPDGYILNSLSQPNGGGMWRKNAYKNESGVLTGVDLNRNYGFKWGIDNEGSSANPRSETYRGVSAFSEPETQAMSSFITDNNFKLCLNFHSHGNFLIHPWGHTTDLNPDANLFNILASSMADENCYATGTGQNTVGYMVNGDADDWLYGDVVTKNRVFSFTPEVGKSFYPPKSDIIDLCKSTLEMNLTIPRIARNYAEAKPLNLPLSLQDGIQRIGFELRKVGFQKDGVRIKLKLDKGTALSGKREVEYVSNVLTGEKDSVYFEYKLNRDVADGEEIKFDYTVLYDEIEETKSFVLPYFRALPNLESKDNFENTQAWTTNGSWNRTSILAAEGKFSFTDTPGGLYASNSSSHAVMPGFLDLSKASKAILKFKAKWFIEENFDKAQVQISTDGKNFVPLCGKFTRTNSFNEIVYDGFQDGWVQEEISLSSYIGSPKVFIRFIVIADQLSQFDGIYIDDFFVEVVSKSLISSTAEEELSTTIYPSPVGDLLQLDTDLQFESFKIYNFFGQMVKKGSTFTKLDVSILNSGMYILELSDNKGLLQTQKFMKQ